MGLEEGGGGTFQSKINEFENCLLEHEGLNCGRKKELVRNILRIWKATLYASKRQVQSNTVELVKEVGGNRVNFVQLEASGTSGGIIILCGIRGTGKEWLVVLACSVCF